ncbi:MAG: BatD family protein, partial [Phycisphaerales bacterium]
LQPPPLDRVRALQEDFKIPADPLAGVVNGSIKTFTQTVRARHDQVTEIPPIPFASFDPDREEYVVVWSDAIPITVRPTATLSMAEVVEAEGPGQISATELTEAAGGILANYTKLDELLAEQDSDIPLKLALILLIVPPVAYLATFITQKRVRRLRGDVAYARRRKARPLALSRIRKIASGSSPQDAELAAGAVREYVADRCNLAPGAATAAEVVAQMRRNRVRPELIEDVQNLLADCEQMTYAGGGEARVEDLADRARKCIIRLEREHLK